MGKKRKKYKKWRRKQKVRERQDKRDRKVARDSFIQLGIGTIAQLPSPIAVMYLALKSQNTPYVDNVIIWVIVGWATLVLVGLNQLQKRMDRR